MRFSIVLFCGALLVPERSFAQKLKPAEVAAVAGPTALKQQTATSLRAPQQQGTASADTAPTLRSRDTKMKMMKKKASQSHRRKKKALDEKLERSNKKLIKDHGEVKRAHRSLLELFIPDWFVTQLQQQALVAFESPPHCDVVCGGGDCDCDAVCAADGSSCDIQCTGSGCNCDLICDNDDEEEDYVGDFDYDLDDDDEDDDDEFATAEEEKKYLEDLLFDTGDEDEDEDDGYEDMDKYKYKGGCYYYGCGEMVWGWWN